MKIGQAIKRTRLTKEITIGGLAEKTGLSRMTLVRIEEDKNHILLENAINIFNVLGMDLGEWIQDQQNKF
jgi:transcriptional regulator with XRE-family HTH domain